MKTAKFPSELEETTLIDTDGYVLVSDADGQAKKMRPSVTHTRSTFGDGATAKVTNMLTEDGTGIVESQKVTKNGYLTHDKVYLRTADGNEVLSARRDQDADTGKLTHDEVYLRTAESNDVLYAQRKIDADTGNITHDEVYLRTADGYEVVSARREIDADTGNITHDEVYLRTAEGNEALYAQREIDADTGNLTHDEVYLRTANGSDVLSAQREIDADTGYPTHDEVYLRTADGNEVVKGERTFDGNGVETDRTTTLYAQSLKSLKVETDDGTFTAEQLACGSGRANGTVHQITSATQTIDINGETISVIEISPTAPSSITLTLDNVPTSNDSCVLLGGRLIFINSTNTHVDVAILATGMTGVILVAVDSPNNVSSAFFTMDGKFFG